MTKLEWGFPPTLKFENEEELYRSIGQLTNTEAFTISLEPNKKTGSFSDAFRARMLSGANEERLTNSLRKKMTTANRINCNEFIMFLISEHGFLMSGNTVVRTFDNVINTIDPEYQMYFIEGYNDIYRNSKKKLVYTTDYIEIENVSLLKTEIPTRIQRKKQALNRDKKTGKRDYIQKAISDFEIGEAGERVVFEQQKKVLESAYNEGLISKEDLKNLVWVSREDDSLGYDILSFDVEKKIPIYIEVKTTTGSQYTPFYMSKSELETSKKYAEQYRLYRLFNLKKNKIKTVNYYIVEGDIANNKDMVLEILGDAKVFPNNNT